MPKIDATHVTEEDHERWSRKLDAAVARAEQAEAACAAKDEALRAEQEQASLTGDQEAWDACEAALSPDCGDAYRERLADAKKLAKALDEDLVATVREGAEREQKWRMRARASEATVASLTRERANYVCKGCGSFTTRAPGAVCAKGGCDSTERELLEAWWVRVEGERRAAERLVEQMRGLLCPKCLPRLAAARREAEKGADDE